MHSLAYTLVSTIPCSVRNTSLCPLLCGSVLRPGSGISRLTPCADGKTAPVPPDSVPHRCSSERPGSSARYAPPGTPAGSLSHDGCSRTPVARWSRGLLGGWAYAPRPGRSGSHRHIQPRCPAEPVEPHSHSTKGLALLSA